MTCFSRVSLRNCPAKTVKLNTLFAFKIFKQFVLFIVAVHTVLWIKSRKEIPKFYVIITDYFGGEKRRVNGLAVFVLSKERNHRSNFFFFSWNLFCANGEQCYLLICKCSQVNCRDDTPFWLFLNLNVKISTPERCFWKIVAVVLKRKIEGSEQRKVRLLIIKLVLLIRLTRLFCERNCIIKAPSSIKSGYKSPLVIDL